VRIREFVQEFVKNPNRHGRFAMEVNNHVFTVDELAAYLKVSKSTLYKLLAEGKVPGQKVGRHWRFSKAAVDKWLEEPMLGLK
jgi:excisionase family DNA binding protein